MSLNVLAKVQAAQYGAALETEKGADQAKDIARGKQVDAVESITKHKLDAQAERKKQDKKAFLGTVGGVLAAVGAVAGAVAIAAATVMTFGVAAVFVAGVAIAAAGLVPAGRKLGRDVWGKVNAVKAQTFEKMADLTGIQLTRAQAAEAKAVDSAEKASASADEAARFAKQIRLQKSDLYEEKEAA